MQIPARQGLKQPRRHRSRLIAGGLKTPRKVEEPSKRTSARSVLSRCPRVE